MQSWSWLSSCIPVRTHVIQPHFTQADPFTKQEVCLACFSPLAAGLLRIPDQGHLQVARLADQARRLQGRLHDFLPSQVPIQQQQTEGHCRVAPAEESMQAQLHPNSLAM